MRISDWSSDVCSSDLFGVAFFAAGFAAFFAGADFAAVFVAAGLRLRPVAALPRVRALAERVFFSMSSASTTSSDRLPAALAMAVRASASVSLGVDRRRSPIARGHERNAIHNARIASRPLLVT